MTVETVILDLTAGTVRHGDRVVAVHHLAARYLRALTMCGGGFLADHIVGLLEDTIRQTRVSPLRAAFHAIGVSSSIERVRYRSIAGHRLPPSLRVLVVEDDHPHASTIAATTTQPSATAPATSTTRIDHSSSLSSLRRASVSSSGAHASTGDVQSIGAVSASTSSALLLVGDEQGGAKRCETIRARPTETLRGNQ